MAASPSHPSSSLARLGNVPLDADEARAFLGRRLRLSTAVLAALWGLTWGLGIAYVAASDPARALAIARAPQAVAELASFAALAGAWVWLRRARPSLRALEIAEAALTVAQGIALGIVALPMPDDLHQEANAVFGVEVVLALRAALVPSSPRRTAIVGALACVPSALAWLPRDGAPSPYYATTIGAVFGIAMWGAASIGATVVVSAVVFRLTQRVRAAMQLGQYTLEERIGEGGMGVVYRARHALLRRPTAIKLLPSATPDAIARFEREAQRTAELASPHVVAVYDFGRTAEGIFYCAMELIDGFDLDTILREAGPLPPARVRWLVRQIADALADAHEVGLVHRDVKPANVLVTSRPRAHDLAKLVDFGLVRAIDRDAREDGGPRGTPLYMAPEAFAGREVDDRADLYALGATAYALLTGGPPFRGDSVLALAEAHAKQAPEPPSLRLGRAIPKSLEAIVLACLAKDPNDRPEAAEAIVEALDACDDVAPWTEADARAWWSAHAPKRGATLHASDARTIVPSRRGVK